VNRREGKRIEERRTGNQIKKGGVTVMGREEPDVCDVAEWLGDSTFLFPLSRSFFVFSCSKQHFQAGRLSA